MSARIGYLDVLALLRGSPGQLTSYYARKLGMAEVCGGVSTVSGLLGYLVGKELAFFLAERMPNSSAIRNRWWPTPGAWLRWPP